MVRPSQDVDAVPVCIPNHGCHCKGMGQCPPIKNRIRACYCDDACVFFDDCCYGYEHDNSVSDPDGLLEYVNRPTQNMSLGNFMCTFVGKPKDVPDETVNYGYWFISSCPRHTAYEPLRLLCEDPPSDGDLLLKTPASGRTKGISYRNIYCAICNGEDYERLTLWKVESYCTSDNQTISILEKLQKNESDALDFEDMEAACSVVFVPPSPLDSDSRYCFPDVTTNCTLDRNDSLSDACSSYTAIVVHPSFPQLIFKNPHCALQCGVNFTDNEITSACIESGMDSIVAPNIPSFSILIDYSGRFTVENSEMVLSNVHCPQFFVFDPFANRCVFLSCPGEHRLDNGQCVTPPDTPPSNNLKFQVVVNLVGDEVSCRTSNVDQILYRCLTDPLLHVVGKTNVDQNISFQSGFLGGNMTICRQSDENTTSFEISLAAERASLETLSMDILEKALDSLLLDSTRNVHECLTLGTGVVLRSVGLARCYSGTCDMRRIGTGNCATVWLNLTQAPLVDNPPGFLYANDTWFSIKQTIFDTVYFWRPSAEHFEKVGTRVQICDGEKLTCAYVTLDASLFRPISVEPDDYSLEYLPTGVAVDSGNYSILRNGSTQMCSFFDRNGTQNTTTESPYDPLDQTITLVGCSLSMFAAAFTFVTYLIFPSLRNNIRCPLMNLTASIILADLMFLLRSVATVNDILCTAVAFSGHVFWLVTSAWSNVIAFSLNQVFSRRAVLSRDHHVTSKKLLLFYLYAWGVPCCIALPCLAIDVTHYSQLSNSLFQYRWEDVCWIAKPYQMLCAFMLPMAASVLVNVAMFIHTVRGIRITKTESKMVKGDVSIMRQAMEELPIYLKVGPIVALIN